MENRFNFYLNRLDQLEEATMTNNSNATVEEFKVDDDNDGFVPLHSLMCQ